LQLHQSLKDQLLEGIALHDLAYIHQFLDEQESAKEFYIRALGLFRGLGNQVSEGLTLSHLATIYREQGALEHAEKAFQEALGLFREVGNTLFEALTLVQYIKLKRWMGEPVHTLEAGLNRAQQLMGDSNNPLYQISLLCEFGHVRLTSGKSAEQFVEQAQKLALQMGLLPQKETPTSKMITRLYRAQQMHLKDGPLLYGELMSELPGALQPLSIPMFD
jgi:tetratricopeptide (TPR) repeat protein